MKFSTFAKGFFLLVIAGVVLGVLLGVVTDQFRFKGWQEIKNTNPPQVIAFSSVAYDTNSNYALLFGGTYSIVVEGKGKLTWSSDTWKWDGKTWEQVVSRNAPLPREKHAMAYDENRDVIVLFGGTSDGNVFSDTWEWYGEDWIEKKPQHVPPNRCCHSMAYDPVRKGVILYSGWDGTSIFWDDTWLWDGEDWTKLPYTSPQMSGHALVQYPPDNVLLSVQTSNLGTWSLSTDGWSDLSIQSPPSRSDGRADYGEGRIIYFGGSKDSIPMNDTWMFTSNSWFQLRLPNSPAARYGHVLFYDPIRASFIMFGGSDGKKSYNDVWELKLPADISNIAISPSPIP